MSISRTNQRPHSRFRRSLRLAAAGVALTTVLAACGSDDKSSSTTAGATTTSAGAATTAGSPTTGGAGSTPASGKLPKLGIIYSADWKDGSWGEFAYDGVNALKAEGKVSDVSLQDNVQPGADAQNALRALADDGFNPIIAHSFNYGDDVKAVAKDYPNTIFVYAGGFGDVAANVGDYAQPFYEPAYLEGILAAGAAQGKVAGAGGFDIPVCRAMKNAFLAGVQTITPGTTGDFVAVGDWYDVQKAKEAAIAQGDAGAKLYIGCGQGPTFGQIQAANENGGVSMGYVGDMSAVGPSVLASFTWNLHAVFQQMVDDVVAGKTAARYYEVKMKDGGMDVVISPSWKDKISAAAMTEFTTQLAAIKSGSFEIPYDDKS
ncbi:MAG: family transporter substrate-binding protein [Ilumatobacteraceae bacterium]|nr:family transporter substrate-binding protein [Ilumatobacteraceae bacterium]